MMYHTVCNFNKTDIGLVETKNAKICARVVSQMAGKFYKTIDFTDFIT